MSVRLELLHIFDLNVKIEVGIPKGIDIEIYMDSPINLFNLSILEITSYSDHSKGPKL
jgi:hypothetical protein